MNKTIVAAQPGFRIISIDFKAPPSNRLKVGEIILAWQIVAEDDFTWVFPITTRGLVINSWGHLEPTGQIFDCNGECYMSMAWAQEAAAKEIWVPPSKG